MKNTIRRATEGAKLGGIIGSAIGTLQLLATGATGGIGPAFVMAATRVMIDQTARGAAIGTLVGGTAGGISGAVEDLNDNKQKGGNYHGHF